MIVESFVGMGENIVGDKSIFPLFYSTPKYNEHTTLIDQPPMKEEQIN